MLYAENSIQEMKKEDIVNKLSSNPLYEQVFNRIKDSVRSGEYKKGDLIPSEEGAYGADGSQPCDSPAGFENAQ